MLSQQKILRLFRLIRLLNTRPYKTVPQLAKMLETTPRSVYRYLPLLEEVGYIIEKDEANRYFLVQPFDRKRETLLETDEAYYLQDLLQQADPDNALAGTIINKLNTAHTLIPLVDSLPQINAYQHVKYISEAIQLQKCVLLKKYHSTSSNTISDRKVEPIHFSDGYTYLLGYDLERNQQRQYKVDRIEQVELIDEDICHPQDISPVDLFGFSGPAWLPVELQLTDKAYRLMLEEYPGSRAFLQKGKKYFTFKGQVRDFRGIGRFILGLPGEVTVMESAELHAYLKKQIQLFSF